MKKNNRLLSIIGIAIFIFCSVNILFAAEIVYLNGKVEVKPRDEKAWKAAAVGMQLKEGDSIMTSGIDSKADIDLDEKNKGLKVIKVGENTSIVLRSNIKAGPVDNIDLDFGEVFSKIEKVKGEKRAAFEVYTLTCVTGVRGTEFSLDTHKESEEEAYTDIACYQGEVYVKANDKEGKLLSEITLGAGNKVTVKENKAASEPAPISDQDNKKLQQWKEEVPSDQGEVKAAEEKIKLNADVKREINGLYERFASAYSQSNLQGVIACMDIEWESSAGQSFDDLNNCLNDIFSTFSQLSLAISGLSIEPSDNPEYVAKVSYSMQIKGSVISDPTIQHNDQGQVIDYIRERNGKYYIGKTIGQGAF